MSIWTVLDKRQDKDERGDGFRFVVVCERDGRRREAVAAPGTREPPALAK
jgi:hypothetical protein